ncbi:IS3 family transposase [Galbibacter sp. BG1]|uniref:IS3 family transposase n=1 Tax=Galbibacter sp. BG1 TaxID=1170699 RepID=UPI002104C9AC|nr:IS3 family transposase [Galbibacter sp. BG1]
MKEYQVSIKRSCDVVGLTRSMWYYQTKRDDREVIDKLSELATKLPTRGFDEYYKRIRREGHIWNRKRVLRVYRQMKLKLRRKHKKRITDRVKHPLGAPGQLNQVWSMDFMSDVLSDGRKVRILNIMDDCNREVLAVDPGLNYPARKLVETLEQLEEEVGLPQTVRCDNGPEFISKTFGEWCDKKRIEIRYTQPGKPMQNGYIERLNRFYREDVLNAYWFNDLHHLRSLSNKWMEDYNNNHPHQSLGNKSPREYKPRFGEEFFPESDDINENLLNLAVSYIG